MVPNTLYYGDNLDILRRYIKDESVDLIYLDPPFNSNATYNVLFAEQNGTRAAAQINAFEDTWRWDQGAAAAFQETVEAGGDVSRALQAFRTLLGDNTMLAYLAMMAPRLVELRRVLKSTGSLYLHCDPTASHYLKLLLDAAFGISNYINEISWKRTTTKSDYRQGATNWPRIRDIILHYHRDHRQKSTFRQLFSEYSEEYLTKFYRHTDPDGRRYQLGDLAAPGAGSRGHPQYEFMGVTRFWRYNKAKMEQLLGEGRIVQTRPGAVPRYKRYLDEVQGVALGDSWEDIPPVQAQAKERLGYQTQKPQALLERIILTSSNEGDLVLDPFCGCGTAIAAAQNLNRRWIGIDITHLAITLIKHRLLAAFGEGLDYEVVGEPVSVPDAQMLAEQDPFQFQVWALGLVGARPVEKKKGADKGIDGRLYFHDEADKTKEIIFQVKGGHATSAHVRDLRGVVEREGAAMGALISLQDPTREMRTEAASGGFYHSPAWDKDYPRIQLLTVGELLADKELQYPPGSGEGLTFKRGPKAKPKSDQPLPGPV